MHQLPVARFIARPPGRQDGPTGPRAAPYDLILLDPAVRLRRAWTTCCARSAASPLVGSRTALMVEHERGRALPQRLGGLAQDRSRAHGDSAFTLYLPAREPSPSPGSGGPCGGGSGA